MSFLLMINKKFLDFLPTVNNNIFIIKAYIFDGCKFILTYKNEVN